jgi:hypothetical protein
VVHIEEVEKVQHFIQANPISLKIFWAGGVLCDERADNGKAGKKNKESYRKLERPE